MSFEHVAIVGLGLMGGSLARDLAALGVRVSAYDADATQLAAAIRTNVIAAALDASLSGIGDADVIVLATPVDAAVEILRRIAPNAGRVKLITDVGSTKARIVEQARGFGLADRFIGSHPMAGDHRSGWPASRTGLYVDAPVYLCANRDASPDAMELAQSFWRRVGALPQRMSAEEHDQKLAWTSHLPHMISISLSLALARAGVSRAHLGPGGRDVTRLAGSSPEMWTAIAMENAAELESALRQTEREIASLRDAIKRADPQELNARLTAARTWFAETTSE
jgi:prephenate dehydrogenase